MEIKIRIVGAEEGKVFEGRYDHYDLNCAISRAIGLFNDVKVIEYYYQNDNRDCCFLKETELFGHWAYHAESLNSYEALIMAKFGYDIESVDTKYVIIGNKEQLMKRYFSKESLFAKKVLNSLSNYDLVASIEEHVDYSLEYDSINGETLFWIVEKEENLW